MNINPLSTIPNIYQNTGTDAAQSFNNQIAVNLQEIKNVPSEKFNLKGLPTELVKNTILKYLKPNDIKVFNEAEVYEKIDIYQNEIAEWRTWQRKYPIGKEENRKVAVERMIDCIRKNEKFLNLSYLNLTSLPNLKSLESVDTLDFKGNNNQIIFDQFNQSSPNQRPGDNGFYDLIKTSCLPSGIVDIELDVPYDHSNVSHHNFASVIYMTKIGNPDTYSVGKFLKFAVDYEYTGNFEKDFLRLYRL